MATLNIFLLKEEFRTIDSFTRKWEPDEYRKVKCQFGKLYVSSKQSYPPWKKLLNLQGEKDLRGKTNSAILLVESRSRLFAITFGQGWRKVPEQYKVSDFGLKTALSNISSLNQLSTETTSNLTRSTNTNIQSGGALFDFNVDLMTDSPKKASGINENGKKIGGSAGYHFSVADLDSIEENCGQLLNDYASNRYQDEYSFVDNRRLVSEDSIKVRLDEKLNGIISASNWEVLIPPKFYDQDNTYKIVQRKSIEVEFVTRERIQEFWSENHVQNSIEKLRIEAFGEDGEKIFNKKIRDLLVTEVVMDGTKYIRGEGKWWCIDQMFEEEIDRQLSRLEKGPNLPQWKTGTEGSYNETVAKEKGVSLSRL